MSLCKIGNSTFGRIFVFFLVVAVSFSVWTDADVFAAKKVTRRALLIGETSTKAITSGNTDAVKKMFKLQNFKGSKVKVTVYNDKTKNQIKKKIKSYFKKTKKNDISYIYLSAHGSRTGKIWIGKGGNSYITPVELRQYCDKYIKGKVVILMSSCYSGNFSGESFISAFTKAKSKKMTTKKAKSNAKKKYRIICSASKTEVSYTYGISWATEFWCKGGGWDPYRNARINMMADKNNDRKVTLKELYTYSRHEVLQRCADKRNDGLDLNDQHILYYPANSNFVVFGQ